MDSLNLKIYLLNLIKYATLDENHYKYEKELIELLNQGYIKLVDSNFLGRKNYEITEKGEKCLKENS